MKLPPRLRFTSVGGRNGWVRRKHEPMEVYRSSSLRFSWPWGTQHDVYELTNELRYKQCDFTDATPYYEGEDGSVTVEMDKKGTRFFASKVGDDCQQGQRVAVATLPFKGTWNVGNDAGWVKQDYTEVELRPGHLLNFTWPSRKGLPRHNVLEIEDDANKAGCNFDGAHFWGNNSVYVYIADGGSSYRVFSSNVSNECNVPQAQKLVVKVVGLPHPPPPAPLPKSPLPIPSPVFPSTSPSPPPPPPTATPPPPAPYTQGTSQAGVVVGLSVAVAALLLLVLATLFWALWRRRRSQQKDDSSFDLLGDPDIRKRVGGDWEDRVQASVFRRYTLREVKAFTGNFSKRRVLGEGTFGIVYLGSMPDGGLCAVKCLLRLSRAGKKSALSDFEKEVRAVSKLRHKNLIRMLGYCVDSGNQIQLYEYASEGSLEDRLRWAKDSHGPHREPLTMHQRLTALIGSADGLAYLHGQEIIHRDVKPGNVLLDSGLQAKVADFGLLKEMEGSELSSLRSTLTRVAGTPGYMDPEYAVGSRVNKLSDVYSLGVVMLVLVTGRRPLVDDRSDLSVAFRYRKHPEGLQAALGEGSSSSDISFNRELHAAVGGSDGPALHPLPLKEWVSLLVENEEYVALLDPFLVSSEGVVLGSHPESPEAGEEKKALAALFRLALACVGLSMDRPMMGSVSVQLSAILKHWEGRHDQGSEVDTAEEV